MHLQEEGNVRKGLSICSFAEHFCQQRGHIRARVDWPWIYQSRCLVYSLYKTRHKLMSILCEYTMPSREEVSSSNNWNKSKDVASLPFPLPPCTLQGRAATAREAAVHHRSNWPWFIGGQSSQQELAQHWQEARQGHAVNISKPTQTNPNPPRTGHHYSRSGVTRQQDACV